MGFIAKSATNQPTNPTTIVSDHVIHATDFKEPINDRIKTYNYVYFLRFSIVSSTLNTQKKHNFFREISQCKNYKNDKTVIKSI